MSGSKLSLFIVAVSLFAGVAWAGPDPVSDPVVVDLGEGVRVLVRASDITSPGAALVFGGLAARFLDRAVGRLATWRPTIIVEHRYPEGHDAGEAQ